MKIPALLKINKVFFIAILSSFLTKFVVLLSNIYYSRNSTQEDFGKYSFFITNVTLISEFLTLGLNATITQHVAANNEERDRIHFFKTSLTLLSIIFLNLSFLNYFIRLNLFLNDNLIAVYALIIISLFTAFLNGLKDYKNIIILNVLYSFCFVFASFFSIYQKIEIQITFKYLFLFFALIIFSYFILYQKSSKIFSFDFLKYKNKYFKYTIPAFLSTIFVAPLIVKCYQDIVNSYGYSEFAILNIANQWKSIVLIAPMIFSKFLLAIFSSNINNKERFVYLLKLNLIINFIITLVLSLFVFLFSGHLMSIFGIDSKVNNSVVFFLALSTIPTALNDVVGQAIASRENYWYGFFLNMLWAFVLIFCFYVLFDTNAIGFAFSMLISYTVLLMFSIFYTYKKILN
jgi:O-antigen/teichoic acid export membrane protein